MRELEREDREASEAPRALAVLGSGRVGRAVTRTASAAGLAPRLAGRDDVPAACRGAEAALLCVPDAAIGEACGSLLPAIPPLRYVGHTSGATDLAPLDPARAAGAETFTLHPLQTVPDGDAELGGAPCAISGSSAEAGAFARSLALRLGMRPFELDDASRAAYHAAASIASNFLITLEESAAELMERAGVSDARELLSPLILQSAANWAEHGPAALTGPIARGDERTVERHLAAIAHSAPELLDLYRALAERTRRLAQAQEVPA